MKKPKKNTPWNASSKHYKTALICLLIAFGILIVLNRLIETGRHVQTYTFSAFLKEVENNAIKKIYVSGQDIEGVLKDGTRFETVISNNFDDWEKLRSHGIEFSIMSPSNQLNTW